MYINTTINTSAPWFAYYGDESYKQTDLINGMPDFTAVDRMELRETWQPALRSTIPGFAVAHYYDAVINYDSEPEYHHYRCNDPDGCDYCDRVESALTFGMYDLYEIVSFQTYSEKYTLIKHDDGTFTRQDMPDYFPDSFMLADASIWQETEEDDNMYHDHDGDYDNDYDEDEDDNDRRPSNYHGYERADIVNPDHFAHVENGWIAPNGTFYYVTDYARHGEAHYETARALGYTRTRNGRHDPVEAIEEAGFIHVSRYYDNSKRFYSIPSRPTKAQKKVATLYAELTDTFLPDSLREEDEIIESDERVVIPFVYWQRVQESTMPRSIRDMFYPLSGD